MWIIGVISESDTEETIITKARIRFAHLSTLYNIIIPENDDDKDKDEDEDTDTNTDTNNHDTRQLISFEEFLHKSGFTKEAARELSGVFTPLLNTCYSNSQLLDMVLEYIYGLSPLNPMFVF